MANDLLYKAILHLGASPQNKRSSLLYKIQTVGNRQHHALANAVKDARMQKHLQDTFEVTTLSPFFCRNHKAIELFNKERLKQALVPQTMTSFSPTRWNVVSAMFTSLRDNKQTATGCPCPEIAGRGGRKN
jgi:hypothetical protein